MPTPGTDEVSQQTETLTFNELKLFNPQAVQVDKYDSRHIMPGVYSERGDLINTFYRVDSVQLTDNKIVMSEFTERSMEQLESPPLIIYHVYPL